MGEDWDILWILYLGFAWFDMIYIYIHMIFTSMDLFCDMFFNPLKMNESWILLHLSCLSWPSSWQTARTHRVSVVTIARPVGRSGAGLASAAVTGPGGGPRFGGVRAQRGQGGLEAPGEVMDGFWIWMVGL